MRTRHIPLSPHHGPATHPAAADQPPPSLPPDLDLSLLPAMDADQLTYLADFLADFRWQILTTVWELLTTLPPGYNTTANHIGINAIYFAKLTGLAPELRLLTLRQLAAALNCRHNYLTDLRRTLCARLRQQHPRTATMLDRLTTIDKTTPANKSRRRR